MNTESRPLDAKSKKFLELTKTGLTNAEAYKKAGFKTTNGASASACASRLLKTAKAKAYLKELEAIAKAANKVAIEERLEVLSNVIRDPEFVIHLHCLKAIEIMNKMEGVGNPEAEAIGNLAEALAHLGNGGAMTEDKM